MEFCGQPRQPEGFISVEESVAAFEGLLAASGLEVADLTAPDAVTHMLAFYRDIRILDCPLDEDGDMLLYEWGTYDWDPGPSFHFGLTRQFIYANTVDDDGIHQLYLTLHFAPSEELRALQSDGWWCDRPEELAHFETSIREGDAFRAVASLRPVHVEFGLTGV